MLHYHSFGNQKKNSNSLHWLTTNAKTTTTATTITACMFCLRHLVFWTYSRLVHVSIAKWTCGACFSQAWSLSFGQPTASKPKHIHVNTATCRVSLGLALKHWRKTNKHHMITRHTVEKLIQDGQFIKSHASVTYSYHAPQTCSNLHSYTYHRHGNHRLLPRLLQLHLLTLLPLILR